MRFVWAVAAFVLAAVMIGAGIAQRTVLQGPTSQTLQIPVDADATYVLVDAAVLASLPGTQNLQVTGDGTVFTAYGRTADVTAWLSDTAYEHVSLDEDGEVTTAEVPADPEVVAGLEQQAADEAAAAGTDPAPLTPRDPAGSDLWLEQFVGDQSVTAALQLPAEMSVIIASDGTQPAPDEVSVTWTIPNSTPWAGPLMVLGGLLLVLGIVLYVLAIRHVRRSRGPRRKGLPVPVTEPIDIAQDDSAKGVISAGTPSRRSLSGRRPLLVLPALAAAAVLVAGCSPDAWPDLAGTPTPSPTASVIVPEGQDAPAVTQAQAERILSEVAATVAEADANLNGDTAATRLTGTMLEERLTNYALRGAISDYAAPDAIPTTPLFPLLPEAYDGWPRTFMGIVADDANKTASIMMLTQDDAWSPYKLSYLGELEPDTELPDLAPSYIGAVSVASDSPFLLLPPDQLATAYADLITNGSSSSYAGLFESDDDFVASVAADRQRRLDEFNATGAQTGTLEFSSSAGSGEPIALATLASGAIVAVNVYETDTVKPTSEDAVIKVGDNPTVQTLSGVDQSATGFTTTFSDQLFFYVPSQGSSEKIRLLGYNSNVLDAKVIP